MNKTVFGVIITVVAVGAIAGVVAVNNKDKSDSQSTSQRSGGQEDHSKSAASSADANKPIDQAVSATTVEIKDFNFVPQKITVKKGAEVTWTNQDSAKHDVMPDQESPDFKASELLGKGESYKFTFNKVGTYTYHCSPHPYMKASVEVVE